MIEVRDVSVWGFEHAVRGMRNPLNSWGRSDSTPGKVGKNDADLMHRLYMAGPEHRKCLRQIFVSMDITAPFYWWKEYDTYKVGTCSNSCSTMHKLMHKEFDMDDFSTDKMSVDAKVVLREYIHFLNLQRDLYLKGIHGQLIKDKQFWWNVIQMLPSGYNQKRTVTLTYENAVSMIKQRSGHKLDEWGVFLECLESLPYMDVIINGSQEGR